MIVSVVDVATTLRLMTIGCFAGAGEGTLLLDEQANAGDRKAQRRVEISAGRRGDWAGALPIGTPTVPLS
jgi:hypothetical protein